MAVSLNELYNKTKIDKSKVKSNNNSTKKDTKKKK